jgi:riboflavin kinase / FMN adenylyltransferase
VIIIGKVVHGVHKGKSIGFPTVNIAARPDLPFGIYACKIFTKDDVHKGAMHYGSKPALNDDSISLEIYILDFEGDLYGETVKIEVYNKLREVMDFKTLTELKQQIQIDVDIIKKMNF